MEQELNLNPGNSFDKSRTLIISAGHFINDMYCGFLAPLLPLLMQKYDLSIALAASLATLLSVTTSLIQPLQGYLADKMRRPYLAIFGPLVTATFMSLIGLAPNYGTLILILILSGLGTSSFHPQAAALVPQTSGDKRGLGMSIFVTAGSLGVALGPVLILGVIKLWGLHYSMVTIVPGIIISMLLFIFIRKVKPVHPKNEQSGQIAPKLQSKTVLFIVLLALFAFARAATFVSFTNLSPIMLTRQGYSKELAAILITVFLTASGVGSFLGGTLSDYMGRKNMMFLSHLLATPFAVGFLCFDGVLKFICLAAVAFSLFCSLAVTIVMAQELVPHRSGTVSSLIMGVCWGLGGLMLTPLGALGDWFGLEKVFWGISLVPMLSVFLLIPVPRTRRIRFTRNATPCVEAAETV